FKNALKGHGLAFSRCSVLDLDLACGNAARADDDLPWQADEIGRGELSAGPLVGVVIEHLTAGGSERGIKVLACGIARGIAHLHIDEGDIERSYGLRQDDAVLVMAFFHTCSPQARRT